MTVSYLCHIYCGCIVVIFLREEVRNRTSLSKSTSQRISDYLLSTWPQSHLDAYSGFQLWLYFAVTVMSNDGCRSVDNPFPV